MGCSTLLLTCERPLEDGFVRILAVEGLNCSNPNVSGNLVAGATASGVKFTVPYSKSSRGSFPEYSVLSSGINGLTATLNGGTLSPGPGVLSFNVSGTPSSAGTASFEIKFAKANCIVNLEVGLPKGKIVSLKCSDAVHIGILISGMNVASGSGVSSTVPYSGGNGGTYSIPPIASTGVTGLTATLNAGTFANGSDSLKFTITGAPSGAGTASFAINIGEQSCILTRAVSLPDGKISSLNCSNAVHSGSLISGTNYTSESGISSVVLYSGGNSGAYSTSAVPSIGVTGLIATLTAGTFANGAGSLKYIITGTPSSAGTASFALNIGGQSCLLTRTVSLRGAITKLDCNNSKPSGDLIAGTNYTLESGIRSQVAYIDGNGGVYSVLPIASTGVTGLTAELGAGSFSNGMGYVTYSITGTPSGAGTATFNINLGGQSCSLQRLVSLPAGRIASLDCNTPSNKGHLTRGVAADGISSAISYSGGNGGTYGGQTVSSIGVTGLTAKLSADTFAKGPGVLVYTISGTPSGIGTASFELDIGGQKCLLTWRVSIVSMKSIPEGTFSMGCISGDKDCDTDESPLRSVTLSSFLIGESEVTQAQWEEVMGSNPSEFKNCRNCPVERVSWFDAVVFCNRLSEREGRTPCYYNDASYSQVFGKSGSSWQLPNTGDIFQKPSAKGYRLPTEAEWEFAAKGGNNSFIYSGGSNIGNVAWYELNTVGIFGGFRPQEVRKKLANGYGLYDMSGNVFEWCQDRKGEYPIFPEVNPVNEARTGSRVMRGGAWNSKARECRVSNRDDNLPSFRANRLGFRLVL
jgi:formylglycine-generating enzyme required for sulfatase activity